MAEPIIRPTTPATTTDMKYADLLPRHAERAVERSDSLLDSLIDGNTTVQEIHKSSSASIEQNKRALNKVRREGDEARQARDKIEEIPEVFANILGVFDEDYDWNAKNNLVAQANESEERLRQDLILNLQKDKVLLELQGARNDILQDNFNIQQKADDAIKAAVQAQYQHGREQKADTMAEERHGMAKDQHAMAKTEHGQRTELNTLALADSKRTTKRAEAEFNILRKDPKELRAILNGDVPLPADATMDTVRKALRNQMDLDNAAVNLERAGLAKDKEGAEYALTVLSKFDPQTLQRALSVASANQSAYVEFGGQTFDIDIFKKAHADAVISSRAAQVATATMAMSHSDANIMLEGISKNVSNYAKVMQLDAGSNSDVITAWRLYKTRDDTLRNLGLHGQRKTLATKAHKEIASLIDARIKAMPEDERELTIQRIEGGRPTPSAVLRSAGTDLLNYNMQAAADAPLLHLRRTIQEGVASKINALQGTMLSGKELDITQIMAAMQSGKVDFEQVAAQVLSDPKLKMQYQAKFKDDMWKAATVKAQELFDTASSSWTSQINFNNEQFTDDAGMFQPQKMLKYLRNLYDLEAATNPEVKAQLPFDWQLISVLRMPDFQSELHRYYVNDRQSNVAWGLGNLLHGGHPTAGIDNYVDILANDWGNSLNAHQAMLAKMQKGAIKSSASGPAIKEIAAEMGED